MDIFVVTGTHFSQPYTVTSYHADERVADVAATDLVNLLRADLDQSLMGMSYLSRFARVSIEANRLILER